MPLNARIQVAKAGQRDKQCPALPLGKIIRAPPGAVAKIYQAAQHGAVIRVAPVVHRRLFLMTIRRVTLGKIKALLRAFLLTAY